MLQSVVQPLVRRFGSAGNRTAIQRAIASLRARGSDAHLWLPGAGTLNGLTTGNYLESTGNSLATVNNPCGLVLDALGSVGVEKLADTGFDSDAAWSKSPGVTVSGGSANWVALASNTQVYQNSVIESGKTYLATFTISTISVGGLKVSLGAESPVYSVAGTYSSILTATITQAKIMASGASTTAAVTYFSVREVSGIHLTQGTTANKAVLRRGLTNLLPYSNDFSQWSKSACTVTATGVADPWGGLLASTVTASGSAELYKQIATSGVKTSAIWIRRRTGSGSISIRNTANSAWIALTVTSTWTLFVNDGGTVGASGWCDISFPTSGDAIDVCFGGVFDGTLTASQIIAAGGIPVTTTAAASNPTAGKYSWAFDSTDVLSATIPAGWETATIIDAAPTGAVASVQNVVGTHSIRGAMVTGVNLVTNGGFDSGTDTGWSASTAYTHGTASVVSNAYRLTLDGAGFFARKTQISITSGKTYYVSFDKSGTADYSTSRLRVGTVVDGTDVLADIGGTTVSGAVSGSFVAAVTASVYLTISSNGSVGQYEDFDNISVYEINPVTHARILVKGTLTDAETNLYKSLANSFK